MSFLRKAMLAIALVIPVAVAPSIAGDHKVKGQTITEVAASNPDFSTLVAALKAADLADALKGAGPFTVFAPTNRPSRLCRPARSRTCSRPRTRRSCSRC